MKSIKHYIKKAIDDPTKVLRKLDKIFLRGWGRKRITAIEEKKLRKMEQYIAAHPEEYYDKQMAEDLRKRPMMQQLQFAVKDVLLAQFANGEAVFYDIAVRVLAIEQYYRKNTIGYDLYNRMMRSQNGYGDFWMTRFEKLIRSCEKEGLDDTKPIELDENLMLIDGAGRLALALFHKEEFIQARVHKTAIYRPWNYSLLWELNFSAEEIKLIHEKAIELFEECKYLYTGVIWPPAFHRRDEIVKEIDAYLKNGQYPPLQSADCKVVKYVDISFDELELEGFIRGMYYVDGMTEWGINHKLQIMQDGRSESGKYPIRILYVDVLNPEIRRNEGNSSARSLPITRIKKVIRNRFKEKIKHYEYDNILHLNDNYIQSKFSDLAITVDKDVSELFSELNEKYEYVLVKQYKRQSYDFPKSFYYHTDVDVVVNLSDMNKIGDMVENWWKEKHGNLEADWVDVKREIYDEEQKIIVTFRGWRCYMVHLQTVTHFGMGGDYNSEFISKRVQSENKMYYVLPPKYDMLIRAAELVHHPNREWHREYIKEFKKEYNEQLADVVYANNLDMSQQIKQVIATF